MPISGRAGPAGPAPATHRFGTLTVWVYWNVV
jgi:hypothetical protein